MKIEQLIVQYLYKNKIVTLQDIGTFTVADDITIPTDIEKDTVLPENAIQYKYDAKAGVDEGLINYVIENTRKIRPLATSDLESYVMLNKQFLNIGKPLTLEGVGILQKINDGTYSFAQSNTSHVVLKDAPKIVTEKIIEKISFATPEKNRNAQGSKGIIVGLIALVVVIAALATYFALSKNTERDTENTIAKKEPTTAVDTVLSTSKVDSQLNVQKQIVADNNSFYIVLNKFTNLALANKRMATLKSYGHNTIVATKDSVTYLLKIPFNLPLQDTLRVKDSLNKIFNPDPYVELP